MTVNDTDKFLVNRSGSSYHLEAQNLMAELQDDDLMLVNRSGKSYKATGAEIKGSLKPPATVIKPQIIIPTDGAGITSILETDVIISIADLTSDSKKYAGRATNAITNWDCSSRPVVSDVPIPSWDSLSSTYSGEAGTPPSISGDFSTYYFKFDYAAQPSFVNFAGGDFNRIFIVFYSDDGINWTFDQDSTDLGGIHGIPQYPALLVQANSKHKYWLCSIASLSAYTTNALLNSTQEMPAANYGLGDLVNQDTTQLTFAGPKDLAKFKSKDPVKQDNDGAEGIVSTVGPGNTMVLATTSGAWSPNTNNYIIGPEFSNPNAPDPSGVTFVGSTFASSDGSLDPGSADWQVTTLADTGYSSIVSEVEKHPEMTPAPVWTSGALEGETEYRARTKYYAASGEASAWSDDVTFKTDSDDEGIGIISKPGQIWSASQIGRSLDYRAASSKIAVACFTDNTMAVGTDMNMYIGANASSNLATPSPKVTFEYIPISASGAYGGVPAIFVRPDGKVDAFDKNGQVIRENFEISSGVEVKQVALSSSWSSVAALSKDGRIFVTEATADITTQPWTELPGTAESKFTRVCSGAKHTWDGVQKDKVFFAVRADGSVMQTHRLSQGPDVYAQWSDTGLTGIKDFIALFYGGYYCYALKADGSEIQVGGNLLGFGGSSPPTSFAPPAGQTWKQVGGSYTVAYFLTDAGDVYCHSYNGNADGYTPMEINSSDKNTLYKPNLPKPVDSLSMNQTSASGYSMGFIIPD